MVVDDNSAMGVCDPVLDNVVIWMHLLVEMVSLILGLPYVEYVLDSRLA